jgi:S-adenosylmethionine/arginine decarboxylase-like enzyme
MKDLAPAITRQRLLIEAKYDKNLNEEDIRSYLLGVAKKLSLRTYSDPIIHSPSGAGKEENQGFDAFVPLIDSGISLYVWTNEKFLSAVFYTCKEFSVTDAVDYTTTFFNVTELEQREF